MDFSKLKDFMDYLTGWLMPGNTAVVYKDGKKVFEYSSGYADAENKIKMNGDELLNIYSCSKPVTVTAAMQLFEQGKFLLSDPLYEYIPQYRDMRVKNPQNGEISKAENHITLQNLFTMTAGFSYDMKTPAFDKARELTNGRMDTLKLIECLAEEPLDFEPGTKWQYSLCHDVLAAVVEVISGMKFRDYVKENIFMPLDMNNSFYHNDDVRDRMAEQYMYDTGAEKDFVKLQSAADKRREGVVKNVGKDNSFVFGREYDSGGAGLTMSIQDYGKFAAALANGGTGINGERIISRATIDLMRENHLTDSQRAYMPLGQYVGYGYGLGVRTMINKAAAGSNGSIGEFGWGGAAGATLLVDPQRNLALAYAHHMLQPQEEFYQPRLRNVLYSCL